MGAGEGGGEWMCGGNAWTRVWMASWRLQPQQLAQLDERLLEVVDVRAVRHQGMACQIRKVAGPGETRCEEERQGEKGRVTRRARLAALRVERRRGLKPRQHRLGENAAAVDRARRRAVHVGVGRDERERAPPRGHRALAHPSVGPQTRRP